jgi:hypothetical protein
VVRPNCSKIRSGFGVTLKFFTSVGEGCRNWSFWPGNPVQRDKVRVERRGSWKKKRLRGEKEKLRGEPSVRPGPGCPGSGNSPAGPVKPKNAGSWLSSPSVVLVKCSILQK